MEWFKRSGQFVKEAYFELKKVTWLGRKEVAATTVVIVFLVLCVALYVAVVDFLLTGILSQLLGR